MTFAVSMLERDVEEQAREDPEKALEFARPLSRLSGTCPGCSRVRNRPRH